MKKIPECQAVAESPATGDPAQTMQKLIYSGPPRARGDSSQRTGEGSAGIPYQGSTSVSDGASGSYGT